MNRKTIAFIGGGNMGEAIISKMVSSDWKGDDIHVIDHNEVEIGAVFLPNTVSMLIRNPVRGFLRSMPLFLQSSRSSLLKPSKPAKNGSKTHS